MKKAALISTVLVLVFLGAGMAFADMKVVNDTVTEVKGKEPSKGEQISYYKADRARMEDGTGKITIIRLDKELMWVVDLDKKTYMETTFDDLRTQMKSIPAGMLKMEKETKETDETKEVNGYKCVKLVTTMKMMGTKVEFTAWATKGIKIDPAMAKFAEGAVKAFEDIPMMQVAFGMIKDFIDKKLFPVQMVNESSMFGMTTKSTTTFKDVSYDDLDDSLFELKEGLKKETSPAFMGGRK